MPERGRLWVAFERLAHTALPSIDYCAQYPGTIVSQNGQLFDFQPDSTKLPGIQGIGFYSGSPGITFNVNTSQNPRAVLFFENANPAAPALSCWGNPGLLSLAIGPGASLGAARVTDPVVANAEMIAWMAQVVLQCGNNTPPIVIPAGPTVIATIQSGSTITTIA
jgi:hypothetical protein